MFDGLLNLEFSNPTSDPLS